MNKHISQWMDEAADDIELEDCGLFDAQRITERVREKLRAEKKIVRPRRMWRTVLIAAAVTALFAAMTVAASAGDARKIVEGIRGIFGAAEVYIPGEGELFVDLGPDGDSDPPIVRDDIGIVLRYEVPKETNQVVYKANWLPGEPNWSYDLKTYVEDRFQYQYSSSWLEEESPTDRGAYAAAIGLPEADWSNWRVGYCCRAYGKIEYYVEVLSGAWLYERDMVIGMYGGTGTVEREWTEGDFSCMEISMDYSTSDNPSVAKLGLYHYLLYFNEQDGYLLEVAGSDDVETLEKIAANVELHVTGIKRTAAEAPEDVWVHGLMDVGIG